MKVTVVCYGAMRDYLPPGRSDNRIEIDVDEGASVADVVAALGAPDRLVHAVLVADKPATTTTVLHQGDEITLMPHFTGG